MLYRLEKNNYALEIKFIKRGILYKSKNIFFIMDRGLYSFQKNYLLKVLDRKLFIIFLFVNLAVLYTYYILLFFFFYIIIVDI